MAARRIALTIVLSLCAGCASVPRGGLRTPPPETPWRVLQKTCRICLETETFSCPISAMGKAVKGCISIAESLENCGADLRECGKIATIDKAEMQGHLNKQTARADKNARHFWYAVGGGIILSVITLLVGAIAL